MVGAGKLLEVSKLIPPVVRVGSDLAFPALLCPHRLLCAGYDSLLIMKLRLAETPCWPSTSYTGQGHHLRLLSCLS